MRSRLVAWSLFTLFIASAEQRALAAGDAARGARVFGQCAACHSTRPGTQMTGPSLAHVWNRKAGSEEGFQRYTNALRSSAIIWNDNNLDAWLAAPQKLVPGTSMTFPGLANRQAREDVIAFLRAVAAGKASSSPQGGGMMGGGRRPDLKAAPAAGQVRSIEHCGDTYTIETADGKSEKVWEFNLRFKTDASALGPAPGKPVIVGAGMQGDRASVVFASPKEISELVQQVCK